MEILDTQLYTKDSVTIPSSMKEETFENNDISKDCCETSLSDNGEKCCKSIKSKNENVIDTGMSQIQLGTIQNNSTDQITRHQARFVWINLSLESMFFTKVMKS